MSTVRCVVSCGSQPMYWRQSDSSRMQLKRNKLHSHWPSWQKLRNVGFCVHRANLLVTRASNHGKNSRIFLSMIVASGDVEGVFQMLTIPTLLSTLCCCPGIIPYCSHCQRCSRVCCAWWSQRNPHRDQDKVLDTERPEHGEGTHSSLCPVQTVWKGSILKTATTTTPWLSWEPEPAIHLYRSRRLCWSTVCSILWTQQFPESMDFSLHLLVTRAIHLESVTDMTAETFITCLRRFTARRGFPLLFLSDNGKPFNARAMLVKSVLKEQVVQDHLSRCRADWTFNVEKVHGGVVCMSVWCGQQITVWRRWWDDPDSHWMSSTQSWLKWKP